MKRLIFSILCMFSAPVLSCTSPEYLSTEEAILLADEVIVATTLAVANNETCERLVPYLTCLDFEVAEVISGDSELGDQLTFSGVLSNSTTLETNNSSKAKLPYKRASLQRRLGGACYTYEYDVGKSYLFLLKKGSPYWAALTPSAEYVSDLNDPWIWWVKGFLNGLNYEKEKQESQ